METLKDQWLAGVRRGEREESGTAQRIFRAVWKYSVCYPNDEHLSLYISPNPEIVQYEEEWSVNYEPCVITMLSV